MAQPLPDPPASPGGASPPTTAPTTPDARAEVHVVTVVMRKRTDYEVHCDSLPAEAKEAVREVLRASWRDTRYVASYLHDIRRTYGLGGLLVRYCGVNRTAPEVRPIPVRFEPLPLDETHPSLQSLAETFALGRHTEASQHRPGFWRRRLIRLGIPLLVIMPQLIQAIIQIALQRSRGVILVWLSILVLYVLVFAGVRWAMGDWYLVPRGVVLRRRLAGRVGESVRLYTPADTLLILRMRQVGWAAELWGTSRPRMLLITDLEAAALAGAWTSPQAPPDAWHMSDLD